jgi:ribonuclease P/MRP protein subunit POP8
MAGIQQKDPMQEASSSTAPKRKAPDSTPNTINFTSRNPPWTYLKLQL